MSNVVKQGPNVIKAHLDHLLSTSRTIMLSSKGIFEENNIDLPAKPRRDARAWRRMSWKQGANVFYAGTGKDRDRSPSFRASAVPFKCICFTMAPYFHKSDVYWR